MTNLLKAELYKLKYSKELKMCIILVISLAIINTMFHGMPNGRSLFLGEFREMSTLFISALFAGMSIGGEFSKRTIYHPITTGHSRSSVLISKYISYSIGALIILLSGFIFFDIMYSLFYGWGVSFSNSEVLFIIKYSVLSIIFNLSISSISFFTSILIKDSGMSTAICVFIMGIIIAICQMFWLTTAFNISSGIIEIKEILTSIGMLIIPITVISIGNLLFKTIDIK